MNLASNRTVWLILVAVLSTHAFLVALPGAETDVVQVMILDGLAPLERLFDLTLHGASSLWSNYFALRDARSENERLKTEIESLRMQVERDRFDVMEAERLRALLDLDSSISGERVAARVVGSDTTGARRTITIDKGSAHGLHPNAPVVTSDGVVGRIIRAGRFAAVVQLVSDPESAVGVVIRETRVQGIARGAGGRELSLDHVDDLAPLAVGDELFTSGADLIYPKGLRVGSIVSVGESRDFMRSARIEPAVDLGRLEEVLGLIEERPEWTDLIRAAPLD